MTEPTKFSESTSFHEKSIMIINIAVGPISRKTMNDLHEYMRSFSPKPHMAFWADDQAYLELTSLEALELLKAQFPEIELHILDRQYSPS
ncbi:hypothetical protein [Paracoccus haeundaensis]|uniref:Uncharacterized protein n=2 Tax=Paracoccus TaxID=265 RepID=A0A5C4R807_9RHOB|nr:hypothetical protein [Paracoccus haeundaensis]TNH40070.1 hypothetical protein FHD67_07245 [Paracoccus haeundaensis]